MRYYIKNMTDDRILGYGESVSSASVLAKKMSNINSTRIGIYNGEKLVRGEEYESGSKVEKPVVAPIFEEEQKTDERQPVVRTLQLMPNDHDWCGKTPENKTFCVRCGKTYTKEVSFAKCIKQKMVIRRKSETTEEA